MKILCTENKAWSRSAIIRITRKKVNINLNCFQKYITTFFLRRGFVKRKRPSVSCVCFVGVCKFARNMDNSKQDPNVTSNAVSLEKLNNSQLITLLLTERETTKNLQTELASVKVKIVQLEDSLVIVFREYREFLKRNELVVPGDTSPKVKTVAEDTCPTCGQYLQSKRFFETPNGRSEGAKPERCDKATIRSCVATSDCFDEVKEKEGQDDDDDNAKKIAQMKCQELVCNTDLVYEVDSTIETPRSEVEFVVTPIHSQPIIQLSTNQKNSEDDSDYPNCNTIETLHHKRNLTPMQLDTPRFVASIDECTGDDIKNESDISTPPINASTHGYSNGVVKEMGRLSRKEQEIVSFEVVKKDTNVAVKESKEPSNSAYYDVKDIFAYLGVDKQHGKQTKFQSIVQEF
ncbi:hypothetical protein RFI_39378, partial [Reticulomyxa filosa]